MDADLRCQVEGIFQCTLADSEGLLERESCIDFLRSIGGTLQEANALLKEHDQQEQSHISVKDFLDLLCGPDSSSAPPEAKPETSDSPPKSEPERKEVKEESSPPKREPQQAPLEQPSVKPEVEEACGAPESKVEKDLSEETLEVTATTASVEVQEDDSASLPEVVRICDACNQKTECTQDPTDLGWYCESRWISYYGAPPGTESSYMFLHTNRLVKVKDGRVWPEVELLSAWNAHPIPKWPPRMPPCGPVSVEGGDPTQIGDAWVPVQIHVNPGLVGQWARQCTREYRPYPGEILCKKYKIEHAVGAGHFTRAYLATDLETNTKVCIKRHGGLTVELMTDLLTISRRVESVDPEGQCFSRLIEAFFDMVGYTVETLFEGRNCMEICRSNPLHFKDLKNLRTVAVGCLRGLSLLCDAGVVHCDMKADNFMWTKGTDGSTVVRLVDFGCSRLDSRLENGRNWAFAEGGAGHIGKWAPEMMLRLPITDKADVWGQAVALLELYSGRNMWNEEEDTVEYMLAQALGLVNQKAGLPEKLLRRSPLDIRQLYTPSPAYFPVQRMGVAPHVRFKELRPATWGLSCILGDETKWDKTKKQLADYVLKAMALDPEDRPHAVDLMPHDFINFEVEDQVPGET